MRELMIVGLTILSFLSMSFGDDVSVVISEKTVNDFIEAIEAVSGKGTKRGIKYKWKVKNAKIDFEEESAEFIATVDLSAGVFKTSDVVKSKVNLVYDSETNKISMTVEKAIFKIRIKVLGQKIKVGEVDIAKYYKPKFEFNGPQPIQKLVTVKTSANTEKQLQVNSVDQELKIEKDQIRVSVDLTYTSVN